MDCDEAQVLVFQAAEALLNGVSEASAQEGTETELKLCSVLGNGALVAGRAIQGAGLSIFSDSISCQAVHSPFSAAPDARGAAAKAPCRCTRKNVPRGVQIRSLPGLNAETCGLYTKASSRFQAWETKGRYGRCLDTYIYIYMSINI